MVKAFISHKETIHKFLSLVTSSQELHIKWLNTLSYLENCGARKLAAYEHPKYVKEEMLKHAAEEFRHAHYLKKQLRRISEVSLDDYSIPNLMGGYASFHYLNLLELHISKYLVRDVGLGNSEMREIAYCLVTYAIELRAHELYTQYDKVLKECCSKVTVKSILMEEEEHLNDMQREINLLIRGREYAERVCAIEGTLCKQWLECIVSEAVECSCER